MMSLAGASRALVPVVPGDPAADLSAGALPAAALLSGAPAAAAAPPATDCAETPDEVAAELALLPEHPARSRPPPSNALPIARAATAWYLVCPLRARRRVKPRVFSMPL